MKMLLEAIIKPVLLCIFNLLIINCFSQEITLTPGDKEEIVNKLISEVNDGYIFTETAKKIEQSLRDSINNNSYDNINYQSEFAAVLTAQLINISNDQHFRVNYFPESIPYAITNPEDISPDDRERINNYEISKNFGFKSVKKLKGNIGYIELASFMNPANASQTVASVFNKLSRTKALVIDLRNNPGGSPYMVQLISSYLLDEPSVLLNKIYWRKRQKTDEFWTLSFLEGKRYLNKPVYILTSNYTFSAAEEFAYNLQQLKRAVVIGEVTGGGAHPVNFVQLSDHLGISLPMGTSINPITNTNWEGIGVIPDIQAPRENALKVAKKLAMKH